MATSQMLCNLDTSQLICLPTLDQLSAKILAITCWLTLGRLMTRLTYQLILTDI